MPTITLAITLPTPIAGSGERSAAGRPTSNPRGRQGRPFFVDTPLGKIIDERGLKVKDVVNGAGMNPRTMSDILSKRKMISANDKRALARFLGVRVDELED